MWSLGKDPMARLSPAQLSLALKWAAVSTGHGRLLLISRMISTTAVMIARWCGHCLMVLGALLLHVSGQGCVIYWTGVFDKLTCLVFLIRFDMSMYPWFILVSSQIATFINQKLLGFALWWCSMSYRSCSSPSVYPIWLSTCPDRFPVHFILTPILKTA